MVREILNSVRWLTSSCSSTQCRYLGGRQLWTLHEKLFSLNPKQLHRVVFSSWYLFTIIIREVLKKMLRFRQNRWVWLKLCSNSIDSTQIVYVFALLQISKVFSALDKDNDGGIGVDEFVTVCFRKVNFIQICYIFTILDVIVFCIPLYSGMSRKRGAQVSFGSRWCCINLFVLISLLRWLALLWSRWKSQKKSK